MKHNAGNIICSTNSAEIIEHTYANKWTFTTTSVYVTLTQDRSYTIM